MIERLYYQKLPRLTYKNANIFLREQIFFSEFFVPLCLRGKKNFLIFTKKINPWNNDIRNISIITGCV